MADERIFGDRWSGIGGMPAGNSEEMFGLVSQGLAFLLENIQQQIERNMEKRLRETALFYEHRAAHLDEAIQELQRRLGILEDATAGHGEDRVPQLEARVERLEERMREETILGSPGGPFAQQNPPQGHRLDQLEYRVATLEVLIQLAVDGTLPYVEAMAARMQGLHGEVANPEERPEPVVELEERADPDADEEEGPPSVGSLEEQAASPVEESDDWATMDEEQMNVSSDAEVDDDEGLEVHVDVEKVEEEEVPDQEPINRRAVYRLQAVRSYRPNPTLCRNRGPSTLKVHFLKTKKRDNPGPSPGSM